MRLKPLLLSPLLLLLGCPDSASMIDAGLDAETVDAEAVDAVMNDVSSDTSRADAALVDASGPDALDAVPDVPDPMTLTLTDFLVERCKSFRCSSASPGVGPSPCSPEDPVFAATLALTMNGIARGDVIYDETLAQECTAQALMRVECAGLPHGCSEVFENAIAVGEVCNPQWSYCAADSYCDATGVYTGTCVARGGAGDACTEQFECRGFLACGGDGECDEQPTLGEACSGYCDGASCTPTCTELACENRCVRYSGGVGDTCQAIDHRDCDDWLSCVEGFCAESAAPGETCRDSSFCDAGYRCAMIPDSPQPGNGDVIRSCQPGSDLGEACELTDLCPDEAFCQDSVCVQRPRIGEACTGQLRCLDGFGCRDRICQPLSEAGGPCGVDRHCVDALFCSSQVCAAYPRVAGDACKFRNCPAGLYCDFTGTSVCIAYLDDGEACESSRECFGACSEGVCIPREAM